MGCLRMLTDRERQEWRERKKREVVDRWFGGDEERAKAVLAALPYSSIPDYYDLGEVMEALNESV